MWPSDIKFWVLQSHESRHESCPKILHHFNVDVLHWVVHFVVEGGREVDEGGNSNSRDREKA